jgi:hypothetical protein
MSDVLGTIQQSNISKYTAHKNWSFISASFELNGIKYLRGKYSNKPVVISSSFAVGEIQNSDGSYIKNTYADINHLYYNFYQPQGYISYPVKSFTRDLNHECVIYSIPQSKVGNFIKPGSVTLNVTDQADTLYTFQDNGNYELIDTSILTSDFAPEPIIYQGFNKEFNQKYSPDYINNGVTFTTGISNGTYTFGYAANFNGSASLQIENNNTNWFNTFDNDFAISFWLNLTPGVNVNTSQSIISKKWDNGLLQSYPFDIEYNGALTELYFKRSDSNNTSSLNLNISGLSGYIHLVYQKTGSKLELYDSNVKIAEDINTSFNKVSNNSQIYIGAANLNNLNSFEGLIDEIRIYDKALTTNEISTLSNAGYDAFQTNKVGNVFYEDGIVVYSPLQNELISGSYGVKDTSVLYKSSLDIEQLKYYINVPMEKYNTSTNTSLYDSNNELNSFATSSNFTPFITSIGLYDSKYNLVAVAKLGTPVAKRNDIDLNFEIKFDRS